LVREQIVKGKGMINDPKNRIYDIQSDRFNKPFWALRGIGRGF